MGTWVALELFQPLKDTTISWLFVGLRTTALDVMLESVHVLA
jgi:hypothetical protein